MRSPSGSKNPYKAVMPIVSGIAYVENPIPELVKGSRTPYREYNSDFEGLAPRSRDDAFAREIEKLTGVYDFQIRIFRALGSGKHWVGVAFWENEEFKDYKQRNLVVTLQSGKSWGVAENKVLRWLSASGMKGEQYTETGAGSIGFLRWVLDQVKWTIYGARSVSPVAGRTRKPVRLKVGWGNDKRERAYAWLTRLGFTKVADAGDGDTAYILDIAEVHSNPTDLEGRFIPDRYLAGLPPALQKQRVRELTHSRDAYWKGDYSELPTDRVARKMGLVKQSKYTTEAKKRGIEYRGNFHDMAKRVMGFYGYPAADGEIKQFAEALRKSFAKGLAAWKSGGHRPGATAQNWAVARVNSLVVGGKTSWTADKKQFAVLPDAVRVKIESMRQKQNPISVEVVGQPPTGFPEGRHTRFYQSQAALDRIEEKGREVVPKIRFKIEWGFKLQEGARHRGRVRFERGDRSEVTLVVDATRTQFLSDEADRQRRGREAKVTLYTAHTILHRLGDLIMPAPANLPLMEFRWDPVIERGVQAGLYVTERVERAWRLLSRALAKAWHHFGTRETMLNRWLASVVDTRACREGWVTDGLQALAETVPYRLLYKKGREEGVKLKSDLPFVPELEKALTEYIDAVMEMLKGYQVEI
jgi:hypothetical protein